MCFPRGVARPHPHSRSGAPNLGPPRADTTNGYRGRCSVRQESRGGHREVRARARAPLDGTFKNLRRLRAFSLPGLVSSGVSPERAYCKQTFGSPVTENDAAVRDRGTPGPATGWQTTSAFPLILERRANTRRVDARCPPLTEAN